jgi:hypothetical protein
VPTVGAVKDRLTTIVSIAGVGEDAARASVRGLVERLRREPRVLSAEAAWEGARSRLEVTVESETDGPIADADEADNFHRVWRCAVACLGADPAALRFDIEGSA